MTARPILALAAGLGLLFLAHSALAGPGFQATGFITSGANIGAVLAATEELWSAPLLKKSKGRLLLLNNVADGPNPATLSFVVLFPSVAENEAFGAQLQADPAWATFVGKLAELGQTGSTARITFVNSNGDISDDDVVWQNFAFDVSDPAAFVAANLRFLQTDTGKRFPGQVHVTFTVAAGPSPATNSIIVGYESEAEMEAWNESNIGNPEWAAYLAQLENSSEFLGATLSRTIAAWGPSFKSVLGQ